MRILAIIGSPRKNGNTQKFVARIEERMKEKGAVEFDYLFLADENLSLCRGCCQCFSKGEEACPLKDGREALERRILNSDGVILASPVYALNMTAAMKNFFDRFAYTMHRPRFFKHTLIVSVTGVVGLDETIKSMSYARYCGFDIVGTLGAVMYDSSLSQSHQSKLQRKLEKVANKFYQAIDKKIPPSPSLNDLVKFRAQQRFFASLNEEQRYDHDYFQSRGWLDRKKNYFVDARINPVLDFLAQALIR